MSDALVIEAVRKTITVDCVVEEAFRVFTADARSWWPIDSHSIHGDEVKEIVFEEREGGEVYEVTADGKKGHWASVLAWEPPGRLVLAWNILERESCRHRGRGPLHAGGRRDSRRARASRLGGGRGRAPSREAGELRHRLGPRARLLREAADLDPGVERLRWRSRTRAANGRATGGGVGANERLRRLQLVEPPPANRGHVLLPELLPRQPRDRLERASCARGSTARSARPSARLRAERNASSSRRAGRGRSSSRPVSSRSSRRIASSSVSPSSIPPPGAAQTSRSPKSKQTRRMRSSPSSTSARAATRRRGSVTRRAPEAP